MDNKELELIKQYAESPFEEDLLVYAPFIKDMILRGRDVSEPLTTLAAELDLSPQRFKKIYTALKKEEAVRTEMRLGPDMRLGMVAEAEERIVALKKERDEMVTGRERALQKYKIIQQKKAAGEENLVELDPIELGLIYMKPENYYRTLAVMDDNIRKWEERKAKVLGVEVQKQSSIRDEANALIASLLGIEKEKLRDLRDINKEAVDVEFEEVLPSINEDYDEDSE